MYDEISKIDAMFEGVFITDALGVIRVWNQSAEHIAGFDAPEMLERYYHEDHLNPTDDLGKLIYLEKCPIQSVLTDGIEIKIDAFIQHKKGHRLAVQMIISPVYQNDQVVGVMTSFIESHETKIAIEKHILDEKNALDGYLDSLTGLPNAKQIELEILRHLNTASNKEQPFGVVMADIDDFEGINQIYGRELSDEVLKLITLTFTHTMKAADFIGRWKNDEFVFIFSGITNKALNKQCEKIRVMSENSCLRNHESLEINMSVSVAGTLARVDDTFETVMQRVSERLKRAKSKGGNSIITN